jgi:hypothetical protein
LDGEKGEEMAKFKPKEFIGPKSICTCGHTGDGDESEHYDLVFDESGSKLQLGRGICNIVGCDCEAFIFSRYTKKYEHFLESNKKV